MINTRLKMLKSVLLFHSKFIIIRSAVAIWLVLVWVIFIEINVLIKHLRWEKLPKWKKLLVPLFFNQLVQNLLFCLSICNMFILVWKEFHNVKTLQIFILEHFLYNFNFMSCYRYLIKNFKDELSKITVNTYTHVVFICQLKRLNMQNIYIKTLLPTLK